MMKKRLIIGMMAAVMAFGTAMTAYAAGIWEYNRRGDYWWYLNDDGNWSASTWQWIDGNKDDIAECYYFDADGHLAVNTTTPDGYTVDANGAWTVNGVVQTKFMSIYDNEMNRQAVAAYKNALQTDPRFSGEYMIPNGIWLWDVNQDGVLEMMVSIFEYRNRGYFYGLHYDGTLKVEEFEFEEPSYLAVIPDEHRIVATDGGPGGCSGYVYTFDGNRFIQEAEISWYHGSDEAEAGRAKQWFEKAEYITAVNPNEIDSTFSGIGKRGTKLALTYDAETDNMMAEYFYGAVDTYYVRPALDGER